MPRDTRVTKSTADPAQFKLSKASAARLATVTDLPAEKLAGQTLADIAKKYAYEIDLTLLLFRKVCGRVVKTDPVTGVDQPVPFATVQVEDTDCSFLGFFPVESPWSWYFPILCHREVIATTRTDECGNFCVWIPRFDIDHVLRFRLERRCYPILFERPDIRDIIDHLIPERIPDFPRPGPGPDPAPFERISRGELVTKVAESFGRDVATKISRLQIPAGFGTSSAAIDAELAAPALLDQIRPPLPAELRALPAPKPTRSAKVADTHPAAATLGHQLAINPDDLKGLDLRRYIGPFKRCFDVLVPVWAPIIDVPDITFRVLQDTNGDGVEEQIYGEGHFQVRWNAGAIPPVTLHAAPNARTSTTCGVPPVPCGNQPAIVLAGRLPVTGDPATYDAATGYAVRTNRPHPSGNFIDPTPGAAQSPLRGVLSLFGCNRTDAAATHYRLVYRYSADQGATFTPPTPFVGLTWPLYRLNGVGIGEWHVATADGNGWYPIALPPGPNPWLPQDLLLDWPSYNMPNGLYSVVLELGNATTASSQSDPVAFTVDNSAPTASFLVETSVSSSGPWAPIDTVCPVVRRGSTPHTMYFRVTFTGAALHLRSLSLVASGCGSGDFAVFSHSGGSFFAGAYWHWHDSPGDNSQTLQVIYQLPASAAQGTYSFGGTVSSRSFSPSGFDGGHLVVPPWQYDPDHAPIYPSVAFSVFNAD